MTRDAMRAAIRTAVAPALAALMLAGCGPGTGGTGLPPGSDTASVGLVPPIANSQPTAGAVVAPRPLPARAPELEGTIDGLDDATLSIAGRALPRASTDPVLADGTPAPDAALRVGRAARAWLENGRWLVALP